MAIPAQNKRTGAYYVVHREIVGSSSFGGSAWGVRAVMGLVVF